MRSIGSFSASSAHSPSAAWTGSASTTPPACSWANACASVPAAGTNRSGARSRTSSNTDATRVRVVPSALNSSARRPTSARSPTPGSCSAPATPGESAAPGPPSEEEFGGINRDAPFFQRALERGPIDGLRRFDRISLGVQHHHHARQQPQRLVLCDHYSDLARVELDNGAHRIDPDALDELLDQRPVELGVAPFV